MFLDEPKATGRRVKHGNGGRAERLYSSFGAPLPILWYSSRVMGNTRYIHEVQHKSTKYKRMLPGDCSLHPRKCLEDVTEMVRRSLGDDVEVYPSKYYCSSPNDDDFVISRSFVCFRSANYPTARVAERTDSCHINKHRNIPLYTNSKQIN